MDKTQLLEENVTLKLTPLQTLLLSRTVIITNALVEVLLESGSVYVNRVEPNGESSPSSEQVGLVLINSSIEAMKDVRHKIFESGKAEFGDTIPNELENIVDVYSTILEQIALFFLEKFTLGN